jgi:hypothetical protein
MQVCKTIDDFFRYGLLIEGSFIGAFLILYLVEIRKKIEKNK